MKCAPCLYLKHYPLPYDEDVCTHPSATSLGHSLSGREQPVYVAASVFLSSSCKETLKEVEK